MALQIRRGTDAERTAGGGVIFAEGELIYVTDTDALYIGDGSTAGGVKLTDNAGAVLGTYITADTLNSTLDLQQNLDLNGNDIIGTGNININGTITATGNVNIGDDANTDTVDFTAKITSTLTPNADSTYDIGGMSARWRNGYFTGLVVDGQVDAVAVNANVVADNSTVMVNASTNTFTGNLTGDVTGDTAGTHTGPVVGAVTGDTTGYHTGDVKGSVFGDDSTPLVDAVNNTLSGNLTGNVTGNLTGNVTGDVTGNVTGSIKGSSGNTVLSANVGPVDAELSVLNVTATGVINGDVTGNVTGNVVGNVTGDVVGSVFGDDSALLVDAVNNKLNGELVGTVTGNVTGNLTGDVTGNVTGNLTGNVTGDVKGTLVGDDSTIRVDGLSGDMYANVLTAEEVETTTLNTLLISINENKIAATDGPTPGVTYAAEGGVPFIDFPVSTQPDEVYLTVGETAGLKLSAITDPTNTPSITLAQAVDGSGNAFTISSGAYRSPTAGFASGSAVQGGDTIFLQLMGAYDGANDVAASQIKLTTTSVASGAIPSTLEIKTTDDDGVTYHGLNISSTSVASTVPIGFPVVANDGARGTLVPTPAKGMVILMEAGTAPAATNQLQFFDGSNWVNV